MMRPNHFDKSPTDDDIQLPSHDEGGQFNTLEFEIMRSEVELSKRRQLLAE